MNAISYSLFGYNEQHENCLDFKSYLRGLEMNIRVAEVLYGDDWKIFVTTDQKTYDSPYGAYLLNHARNGKISIFVTENEPLCFMMLMRLFPMFENTIKFDRVICRDADSLLSWRERQAVYQWEKNGRIAHVMTDSVSHNIPMMGGMCGFMTKQFKQQVYPTWEALVSAASNTIKWEKKGADQEFLNRYVMPKVAHSITEHYFLGMPYSFREDCHTIISELIKLPECTKELDGFAFHIGAAGFQQDHLIKWLEKNGKNNDYFHSIEKLYPEIFYWML